MWVHVPSCAYVAWPRGMVRASVGFLSPTRALRIFCRPEAWAGRHGRQARLCRLGQRPAGGRRSLKLAVAPSLACV